MSEMSVDRTAVREMVEDFWRSYILFIRDTQQGRPGADPEALKGEFLEFGRRAWERFQAIADLMPPEQGRSFMQMVDEEDTVCSREHHSNPERFYRRLELTPRVRNRREQQRLYRRLGLEPDAVEHSSPDVAPVAVAMRQPMAQTYHRQGIGEMAVRTAVRATIWELIRSLFRR